MPALLPLSLCSSLALALVPQDGAPPAADPPAQEEAAPAPQEQELEPGEENLAFEGALVGAVDGEDFAETPGYRRLVEQLSRHSEEELITKAQRELDHAAAVASPEEWRGEIVHVRGLCVQIKAIRLATPLAGRTDVYRAIVTEADGSEGVVVDFLHEPPDLELQPDVVKRDVVDVEGVFFRTVAYVNEKDEIAVAPYLIARNLRKLDQASAPGRTRMDPLSKILLGAAAAFVAIRVLMTVRRAKVRGNTAKAS